MPKTCCCLVCAFQLFIIYRLMETKTGSDYYFWNAFHRVVGVVYTLERKKIIMNVWQLWFSKHRKWPLNEKWNEKGITESLHPKKRLIIHYYHWQRPPILRLLYYLLSFESIWLDWPGLNWVCSHNSIQTTGSHKSRRKQSNC